MNIYDASNAKMLNNYKLEYAILLFVLLQYVMLIGCLSII